jgi:hypothetical protein
LDSDGYRIIPMVLDSEQIEHIRAAVQPLLARAPGRGGVRTAFGEPLLAAVATGSLLKLAREELGAGAFAVRALIFDKTPLANWKVPWHQDVTIAVTDQREEEGWGPWSQKAGTWHVRPPANVLENMLAIRLHLDDCTADNGPVRVIPGSHRAGRLSDAEIATLSKSTASCECLVPAGGVLLMRPLLLHASALASVPGHRRVLHVDYAASALPDGFVWAEQLAGAA